MCISSHVRMHDSIEKKTTWKQGPKSSEGIVPLKKKKKDCQSILNSKKVNGYVLIYDFKYLRGYWEERQYSVKPGPECGYPSHQVLIV